MPQVVQDSDKEMPKLDGPYYWLSLTIMLALTKLEGRRATEEATASAEKETLLEQLRRLREAPRSSQVVEQESALQLAQSVSA